MRIGLDISGGDKAPKATLQGALEALSILPPSTEIALIGREADVLPFLDEHPEEAARLHFIAAEDCIEMGEHPAKAFASKPNSSIAVGFKAHAQGEIQAFASAGTSGAMLVGSHYTIGTIDGIHRPCITSVMPKLDGGQGIILDVGINPDPKPEQLLQFAIMGTALAEQVYGVKQAKTALLNIGEEEGKGSNLAIQSYSLLKAENKLNFVGNVESRDLFNNNWDVLVCDGFTGNVVLKQAEAFYRIIMKKGISDSFFDRFNYENYGGTPILGVNGNVVLGHGISNSVAIKNMLRLAHEIAESKLNEKLKQAF